MSENNLNGPRNSPSTKTRTIARVGALGLMTLIGGILLFNQTGYSDGLWYDQNPAIDPGIPDIGWVSTDPNLTTGGGYCGYVASANVLTYWANNGYPNLVPAGMDADMLMTWLYGSLNPDDPSYHRYLYQTGTIPGTTCDEVQSGLNNWIQDSGYSMQVLQYSTADISLNLIESELEKNEQLIIGFDAHWVTDAGWEVLGGSTWLGVHDPNPLQGGGANLGGAEDYYNTRVQDGVLQIDYGNTWEDIDNIIDISPIPEPSTLALYAVGIALLLAWRRASARLRVPVPSSGQFRGHP